ncbi:nuclear transport factor 2 family protein [Calidithermus roseus]|uniref:DUF4440 domain-containing protein n=1 Tax=Calidithermus roseus TaxID=1644118 RepID=A0A399EHA7_9DEIN|nr:nuclear transport factor 2 family protein [Calidithermus roseus]RIH83987.1 hypothetical protein Mrose_02821 [Calidithermus roseus]
MSPKDAVLRAALERSAALVKGDREALERLLHPNFTYINAGGARMNLEEYLQTYVSLGDMRWEQQELDQVQIEFYGDTAVLTARLHDRATHQGRVFEAYFQTTQVYVHTPQGWRCVAAQTTQAPQE